MDIALKLQQERLARVPSCLDQFEHQPVQPMDPFDPFDPWVERFIARLSLLIDGIAIKR